MINLKQLTILIFFSGCLTACSQVCTNETCTPTPQIDNSTTPQEKQYSELAKRINQIEQENTQLKEKIEALSVRQNNLEKSIAVLADINKSVNNTPQTSDPNLLQESKKLFNLKQYTQAATKLQTYIKDNSQAEDISDAMWLLAQSHEKLKHCESSMQVSKEFIRNYPKHNSAPSAYLLIAKCQTIMQQKDTARNTLQKLIAAYPNSYEAKKAAQLIK